MPDAIQMMWYKQGLYCVIVTPPMKAFIPYLETTCINCLTYFLKNGPLFRSSVCQLKLGYCMLISSFLNQAHAGCRPACLVF